MYSIQLTVPAPTRAPFAPPPTHARTSFWKSARLRKVAPGVLASLVVALVICTPRATHLCGHTGYVNGAVFAPDGRHFVSTSCDHTVRLWDGTAREHLAVLTQTENAWVNAFSPDSKMVVSGGKDKLVTVRNATNGKVWCQLAGHTSTVIAVAFGADGKTVASGSEDGVIKVWNLATAEELFTIPIHYKWICSMTFSPDGRFLAFGGRSDAGNDIQIWDLKTGRGCRPLTNPGMNENVHRLLFSPDSKTLCSGYSSRACLWDVATGTERYCERPDWLDEDECYVEVLTFSPDGRTLVAGHEKAIGLWDVASGKNTKRFPKDDAHHLLRFPDRLLLRPDRPELDPDILTAGFKPNGDLMALGSKTCTGTVVMWRLTSVEQRK